VPSELVFYEPGELTTNMLPYISCTLSWYRTWSMCFLFMGDIWCALCEVPCVAPAMTIGKSDELFYFIHLI
jgi:hypothetical protein